MEVSDQLHAPAALPPGKESRYLLDRRLGGPQSRPGGGGQEKRNSAPVGDSNHGRPAHSLVTILAELSGLLYIYLYMYV
jgi:hypothetical protein